MGPILQRVHHLSRIPTSCYTALSATMGTPSSSVSRLSALRQAYDWRAHGGGLMLPGKLAEVTGRGREGGSVIAAGRQEAWRRPNARGRGRETRSDHARGAPIACTVRPSP